MAPRRIRAPKFDTSVLIRDNALTLIGRVTNPKEKPIGSLLAALPRKWSLKGQITGLDLRQACFQFRFELEEDLKYILKNIPYNYNHWMVIIQRWELVISPLFPSQIPFWIKLQGLPFHFWHQEMIYNIGQDLGHLDDYKITKTSTRIRVSVDGLKPIIKSTIIDFASEEELPIYLEYEDLGYHCSICNSLSHPVWACPTTPRHPHRGAPTAHSEAPQRKTGPAESRIHLPASIRDDHFKTRVDRHE